MVSLLVLAPALHAARAQAPRATATRAAPRVTETDVRFMQGMIGHHAQAVVMAHLVPSRTSSPSLRLLAERIDVSQRDEIKFMNSWLEQRGATVTGKMPAMHDHGAMMADHAMLMPGMLTPEQLAQLTAATGAEFDRLFLTFMIQHHQGALVMVKDLLASPGSGQEPALFEYASDVDSSQRAEIARMRAMLAAPVALPAR